MNILKHKSWSYVILVNDQNPCAISSDGYVSSLGFEIE
jgi:hypothetical protein